MSIKERNKKKSLKKNLVGWLLICPLVIVLYLLIWRPTVISIIWSFFKMNVYDPGEFIGFKNYELVISNSQFLPMLKNTVLYVFWSLVIGFVPPLAIAIMLNEMVYFQKKLRVIIYLPALIPGIAAMLIWTKMYDPSDMGLFNMLLHKLGFSNYNWLGDPNFTIIGIVIYMTWSSFAGTMLLYYASVQGISTELYEAALIDGAGPLKRCWHVTLPQIMGVVMLNFVRQIIAVFQVLNEPLAMTGGNDRASVSLALQLYRYLRNQSTIGQAMALGVIIFLILMVFTCFYFWVNKKVESNF